MKTKVKYMLLLGLLLIPSFVMAKDISSVDSMGEVIMMEGFVTIHMTVFFHIPMSLALAKLFPGKKAFWAIFPCFVVGRIIVLLIGNATLGMGMAIVDFFTVFVGTFILVPITFVITNLIAKNSVSKLSPATSGLSSLATSQVYVVKRDNISNTVIADKTKVVNDFDTNAFESTAVVVNRTKKAYKECLKCHSLNEIENKFCTSCGIPFAMSGTFSKAGYCPKCHAKLNPDVRYCTNCGLDLVNAGANVTVTNETYAFVEDSVDPMFNLNEDEIFNKIITDELAENNFDKNMTIPGIRKRKLILTALFSVVTFLSISLVFFHLPLLYYFVYIIFLIIYLISMKNYTLNKYIMKEVKSRPDEKISNIVSSIVASGQKSSGRFEILAMLIVAIMLPFVIFSKPRLFYTKTDEGYEMRFYAFGWTDMKTATIPDTYKGEPVVYLRGNAFSNMPFLEEVNLPDSIIEIRGQAFKNDYNLKKVNIPEDLEYLGGGAFYNCKSITEIDFPDGVTEIGGEAFYGATNLKRVHLPEKLKEIRGNTFEECVNLESINIPNTVTRIGGHAFYGDISLEEVKTTSDSQLKEIGSSAFRRCYALQSITLPTETIVNPKAFKESPTMVKRFVNGSENSNLSYNDYRTLIFYEGYRHTIFGEYDSYVIKLERVTEDSNYVKKYSFSVSGGYETTFDIYENEQYKYVGENLYIEVENTYGEGITLKVNYN